MRGGGRATGIRACKSASSLPSLSLLAECMFVTWVACHLRGHGHLWPPPAFLRAGVLCFGEAGKEPYGERHSAEGVVWSHLRGTSRRATDQVRRGGLAWPIWQRWAEQAAAKGRGAGNPLAAWESARGSPELSSKCRGRKKELGRICKGNLGKKMMTVVLKGKL